MAPDAPHGGTWDAGYGALPISRAQAYNFGCVPVFLGTKSARPLCWRTENGQRGYSKFAEAYCTPYYNIQ